MRGVQKITISTRSTEPLSAIVEIDTVDSTMKFELNEDMAHELCASLDRFLTQGRHVPRKMQRG